MVQDIADLFCFPKTCFIGKCLTFTHKICYGKEVGGNDEVGMMAAAGNIFLAFSFFHGSSVIPTMLTSKESKEESIC